MTRSIRVRCNGCGCYPATYEAHIHPLLLTASWYTCVRSPDCYAKARQKADDFLKKQEAA